MKIQAICILGGTGFVGRHLLTHLANAGYRIKALARHPERHRALRLLPNVQLAETDIFNQDALQHAFTGQDAVINLVGILNGTEQEFRTVHAELPGRIAQACQQARVGRLLHMSALNADATRGPSLYLRSKGEGEQAVFQTRDVSTTCFRPSVIFGPDDGFFNRFAALLKFSPLLPLACPRARFAPVYVGDVVRAFTTALADATSVDKCLELCGPRGYTLKELVEYTARLMECRRLIVGLPDAASRFQARLLEYVPGRPFTMDNYLSLQVDSVCRCDGLGALGIAPHSVEAMMPLHFQGRTQRGRYNGFRGEARRD